MSSDNIAARGKSLEDGYYRTKDAELVTKLQKVFQTRLDKESIRTVSGISDEQVLDRLVNLSLKGELLTAFKLYPLVEIAWADGSIDKSETDAVVSAAIKLGVPRDSEAIKRLKEWLERGPTEDGRAAWRMFAGELRKSLSPKELATFRDDMLKYARDVAEASGGILGVVFQVSPSEQRIIDGLAKVLTHE
jgi:hypothetical protein